MSKNNYRRQCIVCGDEFFGAKNALYCSEECQYEAHQQTRIVRKGGVEPLRQALRDADLPVPDMKSVREILGHWRLTVIHDGNLLYVNIGRAPITGVVFWMASHVND